MWHIMIKREVLNWRRPEEGDSEADGAGRDTAEEGPTRGRAAGERGAERPDGREEAADVNVCLHLRSIGNETIIANSARRAYA